MSHAPYIAMYASDYLADTAHLGLTEHGVYWRLLLHYYQHRQPLPGDLDRICRLILAITPEEKRTTEHILTQYFVLETQPDGKRVWTHKRASQEIEEADRKWRATIEIKDRKSSGGSKSAQTRRERYGSAQPGRYNHTDVLLEESSGHTSMVSSEDCAEVSVEVVPKQPEPEPEPYNTTTTTPPPKTGLPSGGGENQKEEKAIDNLAWPACLSESARHTASSLLVPVNELAQDLLDELEGAKEAGTVRQPLSYLRGLIKRAHEGTFTLEAGLSVASNRQRRAENEARMARALTKQPVEKPSPRLPTDEARAALKDAAHGRTHNRNKAKEKD